MNNVRPFKRITNPPPPDAIAPLTPAQRERCETTRYQGRRLIDLTQVEVLALLLETADQLTLMTRHMQREMHRRPAAPRVVLAE